MRLRGLSRRRKASEGHEDPSEPVGSGQTSPPDAATRRTGDRLSEVHCLVKDKATGGRMVASVLNHCERQRARLSEYPDGRSGGEPDRGCRGACTLQAALRTAHRPVPGRAPKHQGTDERYGYWMLSPGLHRPTVTCGERTRTSSRSLVKSSRWLGNVSKWMGRTSLGWMRAVA